MGNKKNKSKKTHSKASQGVKQGKAVASVSSSSGSVSVPDQYAHASNVGGFLEYDKSEFETETKKASVYSTVLKSVIATLLSFVLIFQVLIAFTPATLGKTTSAMGLSNISGYFYRVAYNKTIENEEGDIAYLANAVDQYIYAQNHQQITQLVANELLLHSQYRAFARQQNASQSTNQFAIITSFNYDNYIKTNYVTSLFKQGQINGAFQFAFEWELMATLVSETSTRSRNPDRDFDISANKFSLKYNFVMSAFIAQLIETNNEAARLLLHEKVGTLESFNSQMGISASQSNLDRLEYLTELLVLQMRDDYNKIVIVNPTYHDQITLGCADIKNRGIEIALSMRSLYNYLNIAEKVNQWHNTYLLFNALIIY